MANQSQLRFGKEIEKLHISDIETLITNRIDESQNLEYKEPSMDLNKDCNYLAKTISGFLNTDGGILVYGVSEKKQDNHRYPTSIECCAFSKERLENLLKNRVQPWEDKIKIRRVRSKENGDGIFVIEVPRSNSPPHMSNHIYYHRLNFQTQPMTHQNVFRAFQTSWIRRRDLRLSVIEPLYSEIKLSCEKIGKFERGMDDQYQNTILQERYLYDLVEPALQKEIEEFYKRMSDLNSKLGWWASRVAAKIINEELCKIFPDHKDWISERMKDDNLFVSVTARDPSGSIKVTAQIEINGALLQRTTIMNYVQSTHGYYKAEKFEPYLHRAHAPTENLQITDSDFKKLWKSCKSKAAKNKMYLSIWNEIPELLALGSEILGSMRAR